MLRQLTLGYYSFTSDQLMLLPCGEAGRNIFILCRCAGL